MRAYIILDSFLNGRQRRKMKNNTYVERIDENTIGVALHETYVVKASKNGHITLNTGGWYTVTTRDRINRILRMLFKTTPIHIYVGQTRDFMYYSGPSGTVEFINSMTIDDKTARPTPNYWELRG